MEDRRLRLDDDEVNGMIAKLLVQTTREKSPWFPFVHPFADHSDVRDDEDLHLVLLRPEHSYSAADDTAAEMALKFVMNHGARPRKRANRLLFLAADHNSVERLRDAVKTALAWRSIVEDNAAGRLVVDTPQQRGAEKEHKRADQVALTSVRDCYCWLLCPAQGDEHQPATIEAHKLNPSSSLNLCAEAERVCRDNELVIDSWAPIHLQSLLRRFYWRPEQPQVRAKTVWEDSLSALYLPRLRSRGTFEATLRRGAESQDWFATAGGLEDGRYLGFAWGAGGVALDDALLLIEPGEARRVRDEREAEEEERRRRTTPPPPGGTGPTPPPEGGSSGGGRVEPPGPGHTRKDDPPPTPPKQSPKLRFIGTADVNPTSAELELARLADEIIGLLIRDPKAKVTVRVEIDAEFPNGVSETTRRAVSENAATLGLRGRDWEPM
jgi:hypothetical protein